MDNDKFQELVLEQLVELAKGQRKIETRMENEIIDKISGLYDFREVQNDVNERVISSLERIEAKVDVLQMETANIRRVK